MEVLQILLEQIIYRVGEEMSLEDNNVLILCVES